MWTPGWRDRIWENLDQPWDLIIVGGGITGAGVFRLAVACGLKTLLLEANDFSFGTSSRSSKLVHGGLRYLFNLQFNVTRESVMERQWMLQAAPHLVNPLPFTLPVYRSYGYPACMLGLGMHIYDGMGATHTNGRITPGRMLAIHPGLCRDKISACYRYFDANVDDSRLVLRILREAVAAAGGTALNYTAAERVLQDRTGRVCGVAIRENTSSGRTTELQSRVVVNACGPWTDNLRFQLGGEKRLRKLRGSHLVFSASRFPLSEALTLFHPRDRRAMFMLPWEGTGIVGTTDVDHDPQEGKNRPEPAISRDEFNYLMEAVTFMLPGLDLKPADVISTFAGLRPIVANGEGKPSKASRAHALWEENGLITITGGKLTTFRPMARQTVAAVLAALGREPSIPNHPRIFNPLMPLQIPEMDEQTACYLSGRHGFECTDLIGAAVSGDFEKIESLPNPWLELRWAARSEGVEHLDDLLLRRVRLGLQLPQGGRSLMPRIRAVVKTELGWSDDRWNQEENRYYRIWQQAYSPQPFS